MKIIITKILIILSIFGLFGTIQNTYAEAQNVVEVTESIPGANCVFDGEKNLYVCTTERGFGAIMVVMGEILKYFTFLAGLFSVLALVVGGIMYSMGGANDSLKSTAKEYIQKSLMGLVLLLLSGTILYMIAPWVYV
ncbi:MAG: hypothetical protein Q9M94_00090 [Candidatus Gracilibacteria bacterium]|nr:hypothetical protein [Candidatus Gracilibacteria bacterium]MDQ7023408.1 hypothetical protein [Candidatus Gracilibacteria bacterium]